MCFVEHRLECWWGFIIFNGASDYPEKCRKLSVCRVIIVACVFMCCVELRQLPDGGTCGVSKCDGELITYEEHI